MTPATIIIRNLRVDTMIGVYREERVAPQSLKLDLELSIDVSPSAHSDRLRDTVDYDQVAASTRRYGRDNAAELLEHFVYGLGASLIREFPIRGVVITAWKRVEALLPAEVAVRIDMDAADRYEQRAEYED